MSRRFSFIKSSKSTSLEDISDRDDDGESKLTVIPDVVLPPPTLKYKRLDFYYSRWGKAWKYRNMNPKVTMEARPIAKAGDHDPWKEFCFVVVRTIPQVDDGRNKPTFKVVIKSGYILKACKDVIQAWPGISWNSDPLELEPEVFLTFLPAFTEYRDNLAKGKTLSEEDSNVLSSVNILLDWLHTDYRTTIATIKNLTSHGEISWDLLHVLLVPRSIFVAQCAVTGETRALKLMSAVRTAVDGLPVFQLTCESIDMIDRPMTNTVGVGRVQTIVNVTYFKGTIKITSLNAFPIQYHPNKNLRSALIKRGLKWRSLTGIHHMQYKGTSALQCGDKILKHNINGRIMIDRGTFKRRNPNYPFPTPIPASTSNAVAQVNQRQQQVDMYGNLIAQPPTALQSQTVQNITVEVEEELTEDELLLGPTVVYGFSLSDKMWLELNVERVEDVEWNEEAFANLVIPSGRKALLQSLVEAHHKQIGFDDFIKGKGQGLVINLFGPPGVGKTFSAEATSEHVKRPLYVVGAGDLGTNASDLDTALERVFDVATMWKAIVLIDEADVFLEQRSHHDLERNAMVAVFLRHLEYYRGIMFLTTNRIKAFDEAFLSRIHVALHFDELTQTSKEQVWSAFINKVGAHLTQDQIRDLAGRGVNGRQIKNAVRTAHSLAVGRGETLSFGHFAETLDAMAEFTKQFEAVRVRSLLRQRASESTFCSVGSFSLNGVFDSSPIDLRHGPPFTYSEHAISQISNTEAFTTGIDKRDRQRCIVCGFHIEEGLEHAHIIPKVEERTSELMRQRPLIIAYSISTFFTSAGYRRFNVSYS